MAVFLHANSVIPPQQTITLTRFLAIYTALNQKNLLPDDLQTTGLTWKVITGIHF